MDYHNFAEFVAIHYALSHRTDTEYWKANFNKQWDEKLINLAPRHPGVMRLLAENRRIDFTFDSTTGVHCIAAGMNWSPTDLNTIKYNEPTNLVNLKYAWLNAIKKLESKKEKSELKVFTKPTLYNYLKENIYK